MWLMEFNELLITKLGKLLNLFVDYFQILKVGSLIPITIGGIDLAG